jgi:hypothetical protein
VANVNGIMRGMGRQGLGSLVNMCCYYLVCILSLTPGSFPPPLLNRKLGRNTNIVWLRFRAPMGFIWIVDGSTHRTIPVGYFPFPFPAIHSVHTPPLCFHTSFRVSLRRWQLNSRVLQCNFHRRLAHIQHELGPHHRSRISTKRVCLTSNLGDREHLKLAGFHHA